VLSPATSWRAPLRPRPLRTIVEAAERHYGLTLLVYALITAESPEEAVDVFLRREDAEAALAGCLQDEPDWRDVLSIVPIELDGRDVSVN
jgi:hypothetical protein